MAKVTYTLIGGDEDGRKLVLEPARYVQTPFGKYETQWPITEDEPYTAKLISDG